MRKNPLSITILICLIILSIVFILPLINCSDSTSGGNDDPADGDTSLLPPSSVNVLRNGSGYNVIWSGVENAEQYQVYRKQGDGAFFPISGAIVTGENYNDSGYPKAKLIQYAVASISGPMFSVLSEPSNSVSEWVQDVVATRFEYKYRIEVSWTVHPEDPDSYTIYRYENIDEISRDSAGDTAYIIASGSDITGNVYFDTSAITQTGYFYRVTWTKDSVEYGTDANMSYGIYSSGEIDICEPNDEYTDATTLLDSTSKTSFIYSYGDGDGNVVKDTDWYYVYCIPPNGFTVEINFISGSGIINDGDLQLQWFYDGDIFPDDGIDITLSTPFIQVPGFLAGSTDVYFKIYPSLDSSEDAFGIYTIKIY